MGLKYFLVTIYVVFTAILFYYFNTTWDVWSSFFLNAVILFGILLYHIFIEREYSPFITTFIVFTFLFFIVAPISQINFLIESSKIFPNNLPFKKDFTILSNVIISLFNGVFFISYLFFKKYRPFKKTPSVKDSSLKVLPVTIIVIVILSIIILFFSYDFVQYEIARPPWVKSSYSKMGRLIWKKVLFMLPFGGILLCFQYFKKKEKKAINMLLIAGSVLILLALLFWFKNPLTEKRNALGPIYLCLLLLFMPRLINNNTKILTLLFISMIIIFPFSAIITHTDLTFQEMLKDPRFLIEDSKGGGIASAFNTLNYDAFANIMATFDYVKEYGFSYGFQLLSAFLFFVPRSIWVDKPISTGQLVGEHLMDDYGFSYSNLSNPIISEGYINFGFFGVILMAIGLALAIIKLLTWLKSDDYLKKIMAFYFAMHLMFLLRGDFTNGFSYFIGTLVGVIFIPKAIEFSIKQILLRQYKWKQSKI